MIERPWMSAIRRSHIIQPIQNDPRTNPPGSLFGWSMSDAYRVGIENGQADFDAPVGNLYPRDRALLYAYLNQQRHLDELTHALGAMTNGDLLSLRNATVFDVGCGPFTGGLAVGMILDGIYPFHYIGIDRARSMQTLGGVLAAAAKATGGLNHGTSVEFLDNLTHYQRTGPPRGTWTIALVCYLLASPTLDVDAMASSIVSACNRNGPGPASVICLNSAAAIANSRFGEFSARMTALGFESQVAESERFTDTRSAQKEIHYALFHRPENNIVDNTGRTP
ncbi:hypothetical protein D3C86_1050140 [compost metagenome]